MNPFVASLVRHALTAVAAALVAKGYFDSATADAIIAALLTLSSVGWKLVEERKRG